MVGTIKDIYLDKEYARAHADIVPGDFVLMAVSDTGMGMDEATRRRMFDPYFTTKATGTGLGLAVVRQIVGRVGGLTRVESAPGKGTVIRVFFPNVGLPSGETREFAIPPELRV